MSLRPISLVFGILLGHEIVIIIIIFKVGKSSSVKVIEANYRKCTQKSNYEDPKFTINVLHNLQLQSRVMDLIFLLKISNAWDTDFFGRACHMFQCHTGFCPSFK